MLFTSQRSGGNTRNKVTRSACHFHRTSKAGSFKDRQQSESARDECLSWESKRYSAMRRTISSTRRASCMPGRVGQLRRYVYSTLRLPKPRVWVPVVAMGTGDGVLGSIVMPTLLSRTIAPSLRRFPTLSRSSLAFQRTMIEFKQVRAQKEWKIGDAHRSLRRHRTSELDFSMAKHPAVTHNLVV